ncbi:unnamed protein product [Adineta steineri]|uniref:Uncharacterized protein n=1 Tax=Adineta steineri TaxID=433720 RepID=A0A815LXM1_9BILA|nr:unnamed protein product [Adineta steineri]CAF1618416.1 unnamed protein product [Adineta steineri]
MNNVDTSPENTLADLHSSDLHRIKKEKTVDEYEKMLWNTLFISIFYTIIVMTIAILIVCLVRPKQNVICQSNFITLIDDNSIQYNSRPHAIATGDLNQDSYPDLVVANSGTNTIGIFLNDAKGNFLSQIIFKTGNNSRPFSVIVDDFNNNTYLDIAVTNYNTHNIGIYLDYRNDTFAKQITVSTDIYRPILLTTGDLNNDKYLDIIVVYNGTDNIGIFYGYGNGSFQNQIIYSTGYNSHPCSVVIADLNKDNNYDIVVVNSGTNNFEIFFGSNNGSFENEIIYSTGLLSKPSSISINDLNQDEYLDIIIVNSGTNNIYIFIGYENGKFLLENIYSLSSQLNSQSIGIGDFNQDNQLDIVISNYDSNNIFILIGFGNGSFSSPSIFSTGIISHPFQITINDFNKNNQSDIAIVNFNTDNIFIFIDYYLVQSLTPQLYSSGNTSYLRQLAKGDFNNDSIIDLVAVDSATDKIHLFFGYKNGTFQEKIEYSTGNRSHPIAVTVTDIDNDHYLDILVGNAYSESVGIFYGFGNGNFSSLRTYFTGELSSVAWITVDDCNNDHYLDIFYADRYTDSIGVLLGEGNRTFSNPVRYFCELGSRPLSVATGDFNNDGHVDIATACYGSDNVIMFLGFGNGTFTLFSIFPVGDGSFPNMLTVADLNKDNNLDVVVGNSNKNYFDIFYGFGNGSLDKPFIYSTGVNSLPLCVYIADLNNDDSLDLVVANSNNNNIGVFLGNSSKYFGNQTIYNSGYNSIPYSIVVDDFNEDNRPDIAVMNTGTSDIAILLGHPTEDSTNQINKTMYNNESKTANDVPILLGDYYPNFYSLKNYSTGSSSDPLSLGVGDLNNDKQMDIIVANSGNANLGILYGYNNGSFRNAVTFPLYSGANPQNIIVDDFNKDDLLDVAVTDPINNCIIVLLGRGNETFSTELIYSTGSDSIPIDLYIYDLNNDNYLDLVVANMGTNTIGVFYGFDYILFVEQGSYETGDGSNPISVVLGDFNNDGHTDIVVAFYGTNNVGILLGYGNGTFTSMIPFGYVPIAHAWVLDVGDFNNDSNLDITIANWAINSISVILGCGNGSFKDPVSYSTGSNSHPQAVAVNHIDNDNFLDIVTSNYGSNTVSVFLGYGNGTFPDAITLITGDGAGTNFIAIADISNDSWNDIIVANYGSNNVGVFLGYGNGSFSTQMTFSTGTSTAPWSVAVGDFDRDGRLDVATANYASNNVGVLYGYGNGTFGNLKTFSTGFNSLPTFVDVGDFNNDNILDIAVSGLNLDQVGILFGYDDGNFASIHPIPQKPGSFSYSLAIGDFNEDNRLDFAYADYSNNNITIFLASDKIPFGGQTTYFVGENSSPASISVDYFNDDNYLDIAVVNSNTDNLGILFGYGNRSFSNITTYSTGLGSNPTSIAIGDFNNDSRTDIVVANSETNDIIVFTGSVNGSFSSSTPYLMQSGSQPESIVASDFNNDNQLDIVVANFGTNNICVLFGNGNSTFINQKCFSLKYDSRPTCVILKDLNNDNRDDIAVTLYGANNVISEQPLTLSYLHNGISLVTSDGFCKFWSAQDFILGGIILMLMTYSSSERYLLIFHRPFILRHFIILHYLPIIICILYPFIFYIGIIYIYPCITYFDYTVNLCGGPCYVFDIIPSTFDLLFNITVFETIALLGNIVLPMLVDLTYDVLQYGVYMVHLLCPFVSLIGLPELWPRSFVRFLRRLLNNNEVQPTIHIPLNTDTRALQRLRTNYTR